MSLPKIYVSDISAGLEEIAAGYQYDIPKQDYSAIYIPERNSITLNTDNGIEFIVHPGDMIGIPKGNAHRITLTKTKVHQFKSLQPPFRTEEIEDAADENSAILFSCRAPTSVNPMPEVVPDVVLLTHNQLVDADNLDLVFTLIRRNIMSNDANKTDILHHLAEIVVTVLLGHILDDIDVSGGNTKAGMSGPRLRQALSAIHNQPEFNWTLSSLANKAGQSRSVFALKFRQQVGQTPM